METMGTKTKPGRLIITYDEQPEDNFSKRNFCIKNIDIPILLLLEEENIH